MSRNFVADATLDNKPSLFEGIAHFRAVVKPLSETMAISFTEAYA